MDLPKTVGVMILPGVNLFPHAVLPLFVFEPRYRRMLKDSLETHRMFCVAMQQAEKEVESPASVAGLGLVRAAVEHPDGTSNMILQGLARVSLGRVVRKRPYRVHSIQPMISSTTDSTKVDALAQRVRELVEEHFLRGTPRSLKFLGTGDGPGVDGPTLETVLRSVVGVSDASVLADLVSCTLLPDPRRRQVMLETVDLEARLRYLICFLIQEEASAREGESGGK